MGPGQPPGGVGVGKGIDIDIDVDGGHDFQRLGLHDKFVFGSAWPAYKIMFCMVTHTVHHSQSTSESQFYIAALNSSGLAPLHDHGHSHIICTLVYKCCVGGSLYACIVFTLH